MFCSVVKMSLMYFLAHCDDLSRSCVLVGYKCSCACGELQQSSISDIKLGRDSEGKKKKKKKVLKILYVENKCLQQRSLFKEELFHF